MRVRPALFLFASIFFSWICLNVVAPVGAQEVVEEEPSNPFERTGRGTVDSLNRLQIRARDSWLPVGSEGGSDSSCRTSSVSVFIEDDFARPVFLEDENGYGFGGWTFQAVNSNVRRYSPTGRWFSVECNQVTRVVPEGGPATSVEALVADVLRRLDPPEPSLELRPALAFYVQIPAWLAVDPVYWNAGRQATASAGRVVVTGTLTPYSTEWVMGDGEEIDCEGPGTVWTSGVDPLSDTECSYVYEKSSARDRDGTFPLESTVAFEVDVTSNAPGPFGPFPDVVRTTEQEVEVREIQALNS